MKRIFSITITAVLCVAFYAAGRADGAYGDATLNAVASKIAGHPVQVSCSSSPREWVQYENTAGYTTDVDGFTFIGRDPAVIYLAPRVCDTLEADLHGNPAGDYWNGLAIKVLLHESSHQLGLADEAAAECHAMGLLRQYAPTFGYKLNVVQVTYVHVTKTTYKRVVKTVPNPALARMINYAEFWHRLLPANYQGTC